MLGVFWGSTPQAVSPTVGLRTPGKGTRELSGVPFSLQPQNRTPKPRSGLSQIPPSLLLRGAAGEEMNLGETLISSDKLIKKASFIL